ncbi:MULTISPECIES: TRAP transporter small permease [unclassified Cryobacterium]|uniref:TRAP transporter small permease n=1 Tax=unclassified Cryobacterium TaxID=2649013 RepID=UPI00106B4A8F|nr:MULTISPECIES: TRAP transporter small permease [unclassified Cryobacterium]TFD05102.1 TRAP transporter small permease [Cryobacterium sp. TMT1-66-1]TFD09766.1 TRAP transporter small permease [Cryobacterium sp. TMT1-2-2]
MTMVHPDEPDYLESRFAGIRAVVTVERLLAAGLLVLILMLILTQVISRFVFSSPFTWTEELARFALVWLTFISAGFVMARRLHVTVDLIAAKLSGIAAKAVNAFSIGVVLLVSASMAIAGTQFALSAAKLNAPATQIPMSVVYASAVVGFGLIFLHGVLNSYVDIWHPDQVPVTVANLEDITATETPERPHS